MKHSLHDSNKNVCCSTYAGGRVCSQIECEHFVYFELSEPLHNSYKPVLLSPVSIIIEITDGKDDVSHIPQRALLSTLYEIAAL